MAFRPVDYKHRTTAAAKKVVRFTSREIVGLVSKKTGPGFSKLTLLRIEIRVTKEKSRKYEEFKKVIED